MIRQKVVQRLALSSAAASYMSSGICCSPARNSSIGKPTDHQMVVIASAGRTRCGSLRNGSGSQPSAFHSSPSSPASGASTKRQIRVTIVTDSTADEKKMPRNIAAPLLARLSASASTSASTVSAGTIISVTSNVLISDVPKIGSCASRA